GLALKSDGTLKVWGDSSGCNTPPAGLSNVVAIAMGGNQDLALMNDGTVTAWCWDYVPPGLSNVIALAVGQLHSLALKNDGTVVGWAPGGWFNYDADKVPANLSNVVAIA